MKELKNLLKYQKNYQMQKIVFLDYCNKKLHYS